jgi:hypothetical protein
MDSSSLNTFIYKAKSAELNKMELACSSFQCPSTSRQYFLLHRVDHFGLSATNAGYMCVDCKMPAFFTNAKGGVYRDVVSYSEDATKAPEAKKPRREEDFDRD